MFRKKFKYHKTLPPKIWDNSAEINQLVSQSLQMMAAEYFRYMGMVVGLPVSGAKIIDVFIHGSMANYYWDKKSDIDLCVVADLTDMLDKMPKLNSFLFFRCMFFGWRRTFRVSIFGHGVDIFVVDASEFPRFITDTTDYFYSLYRNRWVVPPHRVPDDQLKLLRKMSYKRYRVIMRQCEYMLKHKMAHDFIDAYLSNLKRLRTNSVEHPHGLPITSTQIAFKMARNTGIFFKLQRASKKQLSKRYTME